MAEVCKDIDRGLGDLQAAIGRLNNRLDGLERQQNECCKDKDKNRDKNKNNDNSDLESRVSKIEGYINALDGDIKNVTKFVSEIWEHLDDILKNLQDFGEKLVSWIGSAAKLFGGF